MDKGQIEALKNEILGLFDELIVARAAKKRAYQEYQDCKKTPAPERPTIVTDMSQWIDYLDAKSKYDAQVKEFEAIYNHFATVYDNIAKKVLPKLPEKVWFKHGNYGIGVAYSNWGGSKYYVVVEPWCEKMNSLDHTHSGD